MLGTCPLRVLVDYESTVRDFLQIIQEIVAKTSRYAHFGLQNIAKLGEDEKRGCSLQTLLGVQPEIVATSTPDLDVELDTALTEVESLGSYACWVECAPQDHQLMIRMEYLPDAIGSADIILDCFSRIICGLINCNPGDALSSLELLSTTSIEVTHPQHETSMKFYEETVHDFINKLGMENPEKEAVVGWDGSLNYQELHRLSEVLATKLQALGVGIGTFVPVCAKKSIWVVVGLLAVLRAGGVYVPLDI
jgi:non-ribosomal peptide synthetase component F